MILPRGGGEEGYFGGPLDVLLIQHDLTTDRYHAAAYQEKPLPGPPIPTSELTAVRLQSKMHHTEGTETLEEAQARLAKLAEEIEVPEGNVWYGEDKVRDVNDAGPDVLIVSNWTVAATTA